MDEDGWTFHDDHCTFNPKFGLAAEWEAMRSPFVVADFEVTGIDASVGELLQLAALMVDPSGATTSEFSVLVKVEHPLRDDIVKIVGITQADVNQGQPLIQAMSAFLAFVGNYPVFIHNAEFDKPFLEKAEKETGLAFHNRVYDTHYMAMMIWTDWSPYSIENLMRHLGLYQAPLCLLDDARATLNVLLAARAAAFTTNWD